MPNPSQSNSADASPPQRLARQLGLFDTSMVVVGGMIGSGIFMSPYVVARVVHTPFLILGAWILGGVLAVAGAAAYAELASQRPHVGGQYAYMRDAYHPSVAFLYGWGLLVISQSGGMAAVAVTCARYFSATIHVSIPERLVAVAVLAAVTMLNCFGVRTWTAVQNALTILKTALVAALILCGLFLIKTPPVVTQTRSTPLSPADWIVGIGAALVPVMFAYGGWQTSCYLAGEVRNPRRTLPRALLLGVGSVTLLYIALNYVALRALGPDGLANSTAPAATVMRMAAGDGGAVLVALGVAFAGIGFLNQCMLTVPRVYYAMAEDKLFFRRIAQLHPRTGTPVLAITLQGVVAAAIAVVGAYEQILIWIVAVDFLFYGLAASCVFVFRYRDRKAGLPPREGIPGHPFTTGGFAAACAFVVVMSVIHSPRDSALGIGMVLTGVPAYLLWNRRRKDSAGSQVAMAVPARSANSAATSR